MITNSKTNTILVSAELETRFPNIFRELKAIVEQSGATFHALQGTLDIWCRDYFPIQTAKNTYVTYTYDPDYLEGEQDSITRKIVFDFGKARMVSIGIKLDGGNLMKGADFVMLTEKVFRENGANDPRAKKRLLDVIESAFGQAIIFPNEPNDQIGHIDGEVMLVDKVLFVNDYSEYLSEKEYAAFERKLSKVAASLKTEGRISRIVKLPYKLLDTNDDWSCVGSYVNFLHFGNVVILPRYGTANDERARELVQSALPRHRLHSIECTELAREGGVLNCVTAGIFT